jgi:hypothetical protein
VARREWGVPLPKNPVDVEKPKPDRPRTRRLEPHEIEAFWTSIDAAETH